MPFEGPSANRITPDRRRHLGGQSAAGRSQEARPAVTGIIRNSLLSHYVSNARGGSNSHGGVVAAGGGGEEESESIHIYQALSPVLFARGRVFGSQLRLKSYEWECVDEAYFNAPGAGATSS